MFHLELVWANRFRNCKSQTFYQKHKSWNSVLESERPKDLCQICNIFSCCTNCPSDKAKECFPSDIEEGYTPSGWTPLSCDISSGSVSEVGFIVGSGWTWMMFMMSVLFIGGVHWARASQNAYVGGCGRVHSFFFS